jgi:16S rRNA (uracil1498-N3)-methyltransferase
MAATPAWPPKSAPRLFVEDELGAGNSISIEGQQAHYLGKVMRVQPGDTIILCDNLTGEWAARIEQVEKRRISAVQIEKLRDRETPPDFWLCPALLKKDRFDWVLEKATELGVAELRPMVTRRCVADKLNLDRARTIAVEAAEQCARTALPELHTPFSLKDLLRNWPADRVLYFADEEGGAEALASFAANAGPAAIVIGPEGGFDDAEREEIRGHPQAMPISLGPRILRGETAAVAAVSIWMASAGDWSNKEPRQE